MTSGAAAVSELFLFAGAAFSRLAEQTTLALQTDEDNSGRLKWTSAELQMLRDCVAKYGHSDLARVAETLRTKSVHQIKAQMRRSQLLPARRPAVGVKTSAIGSPDASASLKPHSEDNNDDEEEEEEEEDEDVEDEPKSLVDDADGPSTRKMPKLEAASDDIIQQDVQDADEASRTPVPPPPPLAGLDSELEDDLVKKESATSSEAGLANQDDAADDDDNELQQQESLLEEGTDADDVPEDVDELI